MRIGSLIVVGLLVFVTYIVFSGSVSTYDLVAGIVSAIIIGTIFSEFVVKNPGKVFNPVRWAWLIAYAIYYFFVAEVRAHLDVMYRIIHPRTPVKPGIIMVPYEVESDYAITSVANSITNTPGTVVVDIDPEKKVYYVHWINVKSTKPEEARKYISLTFEKYSKKVFD
ncbi:MAG: cation:proton antiporter [Desulfurococcales archaeon ex4484_58]|nr:MAG: cation:proton antiporter [Desulfurococcales archaeon ex4484_58]